MAFKPIDLGSLNRLSASVTFDDFPELTVTAEVLAKQAIRLAPEGDATKFLEVLTGVVDSPEPFQLLTLTIHMVKTLSICADYFAQFQASTKLGKATVRPDLNPGQGGLPPFDMYNTSLMTPREMDFSGEDPAFVVTLRGTWNVNQDLWN